MLNLPRRTLMILLFGGLILTLSLGIRSTFGLYMKPISDSLGWGRETFALALALQNIVWGISQPFVGAVADKYGTGRVVAAGGLAYAGGLYLMSMSATPLTMGLSAGLLMGVALSGTSFAPILGAISRVMPEEHRGSALGIASALGSAGQFAMLPIAQGLIGSMGWSLSLLAMCGFALLMVPMAASVAGRAAVEPTQAISLSRALGTAGRHSGYWLLFWAFFVCGFQVMFIASHLPAYIVDEGLPVSMGATALAVLGLFNIVGSYVWSMLGGRYSKRLTLSALYILRAIFIGLFMAVPLTSASLILFSAAIGFTWLATVPVTTALVAQMFGVRFLSTLFGIVFLGHQIGSFLGVWLGGRIYDATGSYNMIWMASIVLSIVAALMHLPINEQPVDMTTADEAA